MAAPRFPLPPLLLAALLSVPLGRVLAQTQFTQTQLTQRQTTAPPAAAAPAVTPQIGPNFQYGSAAFRDFAQTSYRTVGLSGSFEDWLSSAYLSAGVRLGKDDGGSLTDALDTRAATIRAASGAARVNLERDTAQWAHTFVKKSIPKFSLERGFELGNVVKLGERQCLAQSVIIAGLLQRAGMQAGAVMVWSNPQGKESNLGHVVAVIRLSSGADLLDDASDPVPFMRHQGLLLREGLAETSAYRFLKPSYAADDSISGYTLADGSRSLKVQATAPLTLSYLASQFDYYRGERVPGGFMTGKATPAGLKASETYLRRAIQENPQNALAALVLGHVLRKQGQLSQAKAQYEAAYPLYRAQGHVPGGVQTVLDWARKPAKLASKPGGS